MRKGLVAVTGCDSGIGKSLAESLVGRGYDLAISYLKENPFENSPHIYSHKLDIREPEEVDQFCNDVKHLCKKYRLKALINNAGVALGGPVENIPLNIYRECFEINYFGTVAVTQALLPELISNRGTIIVVGSLAGKIAMPFLSPYASSKFALEGFCDSLRREMNPYKVKTILIEPAGVATPIWDKAKEQDISWVDKKYMKSLQSFQENFIEGGNKGMAPHRAGEIIADILEKKRPGSRYIIAKNLFWSKLLAHIPNAILDRAVTKLFDMDYGY